ncbi:S9 family peptidase [Saccharibacillus brassicae]|uniref:S9 family peptidase n=1 Tax=Saccharibacillus brassicae TaxID=2583377 RepID=A0A4Y6UVQ5_SACBS|nr:S9 family peptidase [Saccharibacillus brassicae]QDH20431.1 S9 family peptidase [Saccharibacillus brassicae]
MSEQRGLTAEDLYRFVWVGAPDVSKADGRIAYTERTVNEAKDGYMTRIRALSADGAQDILFTSGEQDASPAWSPDGTRLAFARKHGDKRQIWLLPASGGEARMLTHLSEGAGAFAWSPDGSKLLVSSQVDPDDSGHSEDGSDEDGREPGGERKKGIDGETKVGQENAGQAKTGEGGAPSKDKPLKELVVDRIRYRGDGSGLWNGKRSHLFVVDAADGEAQAVTSGEFDVGSFAWSPDGSTIAFTAYIPADSEDETDPDLLLVSDLYVADAYGGSRRKLTDSNWSIGQPAWSPDGSKIAFFASDRSYHNATLNRLYSIAAEGGDILCLTDDRDLLVGNLVVGDMRSMLPSPAPLFSEDGSSVYALFTRHGSAGLARFAADGSGHEEVIVGDRDVYQLAPDHEGGFVVAIADALNPGDLYRFSPGTKQETRLTDANGEWLGERELSAPESFWVQTEDGWNVQGWIMQPVGFDAAAAASAGAPKVPTILEIHGGPHMMYGHTFMHEFQLLAAKGYAVIFANPRGGHGYGQEFVDACRGDYGGGDYRDLMETVDYALANYAYIDEKRLGVTGGSYGGFMTNWIIGHTDRFKSAVTQRSISNWISFYGVSDIGPYFTEDQIGGDPWQDTELLWKHSPLAYVQQMRTPLLILHGEQDLRCPIEQGEQLFIALKRLGRKTRLVRFPGASHDLSRGGHPSLRVARLSHIAGWMDDHLV